MNIEKIWNVVTQKREDYLQTFTSTSACFRESDTTALVKSIEDQLGLEPDTAIHENITEESLRAASEMLAYLTFCPPKAEMDAAREELDRSIHIYTPKEILIILNRLLHAKGENLPYKEAFSTFFDRISKAWNLKYKEIKRLTSEHQCEDCQVTENFPNLAEVTNHPVHILDEDEAVSPSSFIPFCSFGSKKKLSLKNEKFNVPVCNSFKPKLRNDQVCYEMDPNKLLNGQRADKIVLYFIIDQNKDRQISKSSNAVSVKRREKFMLDDVKQEGSAIYLDTIGT